ncbi:MULTISPECIES: hypothetical protein [Saccharothrix]|uniref:hypothetical protein n=1 Tax=Saccharothrix TaxID=2071 RepID=UPI00093FBEC4|nr:hypothetical protein [Saccharothrix sp. CB00851]OKI35301.1 hypothetical protein A6A25_24490 [Saccharothrix sp. CB00851]
MIRYGRSVVDRRGVARACGVTLAAFTGKRRRPAPWREPDFPAPVNLHPDSPPRTRLYDHAQVTAYVQGLTVPDLPVEDHPLDLLTEREAADRLGKTIVAFRAAEGSAWFPAPDARPCGVKHWHRSTLDQLVFPGKGAGAGRPRGDGTRPLPRQRMRAHLTAALAAGEVPSAAELARLSDVGITTARAFLRRPRMRVTLTFTGPYGPAVAAWNQLVVEVGRLPTRADFAALPIEVSED